MKQKKQPNVIPKKGKKKRTIREANKLHVKLGYFIDRFSAVYKLPQTLWDLWQVIYKTDESVEGQIRLLAKKTGEKWNRYKYFKLRGMLEKRLAKNN